VTTAGGVEDDLIKARPLEPLDVPLGPGDVVVTTAGGVEEDLIKARPWCPLMFPCAQGTWS